MRKDLTMVKKPENAENDGLNQKLFEKIINKNKETNFHRFLEMNISYLKKGLAKMEIEVKEEFINPNGICHGGIGFSILDTAMSMAVRTIGKEVTTVEMNINYLKPAQKGDLLLAEGKVVKSGNKIVVCEGELYNEKGDLLANSRETFYVLNDL